MSWRRRTMLAATLSVGLSDCLQEAVPADTGAPDARTQDVQGPDASTTDVAPPPVDRAAVLDGPADAPVAMDVPAPMDVAASVDAAVPVDVAASVDAAVLVDGPASIDVPTVTSDVGEDAPSVSCGALQVACAGAVGGCCCAFERCVEGRCVATCGEGSTACPGALCGECVGDFRSNPNHCGRCGHRCSPGVGCYNGVCGCPDCPPTSLCCDGVCLNPNTDRESCGTCGRRCLATSPCADGTCGLGCNAPLTDCGALGCVDTQRNNMNCGACRTVCDVGTTCIAGRCVPRVEFMPVAPCEGAGDYVEATTVTFGGASASYLPRCVSVRRGTALAFEGSFATRPLEPSSGGSPDNPIPSTSAGTSVRVTFATVGFFPFYSRGLGTAAGAGMAGVVRVVP